jgi:hypothetical protein
MAGGAGVNQVLTVALHKKQGYCPGQCHVECLLLHGGRRHVRWEDLLDAYWGDERGYYPGCLREEWEDRAVMRGTEKSLLRRTRRTTSVCRLVGRLQREPRDLLDPME